MCLSVNKPQKLIANNDFKIECILYSKELYNQVYCGASNVWYHTLWPISKNFVSKF